MPEFAGLPQPFKDSYRKNMPLVSSAYSKKWNNMSPDQKEKFLAQIDTKTKEMVAQIQMAPLPVNVQAPEPEWNYRGCFKDNVNNRVLKNNLGHADNVLGCLNLATKAQKNVFGLQYGGECWADTNVAYDLLGPEKDCAKLGSANSNQVYTSPTFALPKPVQAIEVPKPVQAPRMEDRLAISDYISKNSPRVDRPSDPKYNVRAANVVPGCFLDNNTDYKININGTPSGFLNEKQIKVLDPNIITPQEYYTILSKVIDMQNQVINIPMCDKGIRVNTIIPDAIAYIISTRRGSTSGYVMEGSYLGGLASTKKDWTLIMILFVLVVILWIIAKKM
jgi:hypothetical protein